MAIPLLGAAVQGRVRLDAHVDVWKNGDDGKPSVLVSTSRPCAECGLPLTGVVVPVNESAQAHAACRGQ